MYALNTNCAEKQVDQAIFCNNFCRTYIHPDTYRGREILVLKACLQLQ